MKNIYLIILSFFAFTQLYSADHNDEIKSVYFYYLDIQDYFTLEISRNEKVSDLVKKLKQKYNELYNRRYFLLGDGHCPFDAASDCYRISPNSEYKRLLKRDPQTVEPNDLYSLDGIILQATDEQTLEQVSFWNWKLEERLIIVPEPKILKVKALTGKIVCEIEIRKMAKIKHLASDIREKLKMPRDYSIKLVFNGEDISDNEPFPNLLKPVAAVAGLWENPEINIVISQIQ